jgi:hypothetical protein
VVVACFPNGYPLLIAGCPYGQISYNNGCVMPRKSAESPALNWYHCEHNELPGVMDCPEGEVLHIFQAT